MWLFTNIHRCKVHIRTWRFNYSSNGYPQFFLTHIDNVHGQHHCINLWPTFHFTLQTTHKTGLLHPSTITTAWRRITATTTAAKIARNGNSGPIGSNGLLGTFYLILTHFTIEISLKILSNKEKLFVHNHMFLSLWMHTIQLTLKMLFPPLVLLILTNFGIWTLVLLLTWPHCKIIPHLILNWEK